MNENLSKAYDSVYKYSKCDFEKYSMDRWPRERIEAIVYLVSKRLQGSVIHGGKVLDIGCGEGKLLWNLKDCFEKLYGVEFSEIRANSARNNLKEVGAEIYTGDFLELMVEETFDCIVSADVIEHIPDVFGFFKKCNELQKVGGILILNTPNLGYIRHRIRLLFGKFPSTALSNEGMDTRTEEELYDAGHLHYFTYSVLEKMAARFGYQVLMRTGIGRFGVIHNIWPSITSGSCNIVMKKVKDV